jgi:hypothetical protein
MTLFAIAAVVGCAAGYARNGRLRRLGDLHLRAPALVGLALALPVGAGPAPGGWRAPAVVASYAAIGAFLVVNLRSRAAGLRIGVALLAAGWALNVAAMAPRGAMPVSNQAMQRIGAAGVDVSHGHLSKHVSARPTAVDGLGDVIPVPALRAVLSVGDLVLLAGVACCVAGAMAAPPGDVDRSRLRRSARAVPAGAFG